MATFRMPLVCFGGVRGASAVAASVAASVAAGAVMGATEGSSALALALPWLLPSREEEEEEIDRVTEEPSPLPTMLRLTSSAWKGLRLLLLLREIANGACILSL